MTKANQCGETSALAAMEEGFRAAGWPVRFDASSRGVLVQAPTERDAVEAARELAKIAACRFDGVQRAPSQRDNDEDADRRFSVFVSIPFLEVA